MLQIRTVFFDFDGILVDSETIHFEGFAEIAAEHLGYTLTRLEYDRVLIGFDDREAIAWLCTHTHKRDMDQQALADQKEHQIAERLQCAPLLPGADVLYRKTLQQYRTGIVSGALRQEILALLSFHDLPAPDLLVAAGDTVRGKPYPDPYLRGLTLAAAQASTAGEPPLIAGQCIVLEDTPAGIQAGRAAEMWVVGYTGSGSDPDGAGTAHLVVDDWRETDIAGFAAAIDILLEQQ